MYISYIFKNKNNVGFKKISGKYLFYPERLKKFEHVYFPFLSHKYVKIHLNMWGNEINKLRIVDIPSQHQTHNHKFQG